MKIFFDENFSPHLIKGFSAFQDGRPDENVAVLSIADHFGRGCADEKWIPSIGQESETTAVISQDFNIHRTKAQAALYQTHGVSFFFFRHPKKQPYNYWDWINQVHKHWSGIKFCLVTEQQPFAYMVEPMKSKMLRL